MDDFVLASGYYTIKQAANEKGCSYDTLRQYIARHRVPTKRVGRSHVVRMSDLTAYVPQGARQVSNTR